ncbi:MAG: yjeF-like protein hydroxyethylthiazole kinaserelated protein [Betaproteobacteria bacterium]|nr:yjeF-like protein hydroxyethylthiazole kinaserelated protein [Betaproteobacteria bacterium]
MANAESAPQAARGATSFHKPNPAQSLRARTENGVPEKDSSTLLLRATAIRTLEQAALARGEPLMERAGLAAANVARGMLREAAHYPARVLVLAGPGNNGGDAIEAAVHLRDWGNTVAVCFVEDADHLPPDAARAHAKWRSRGAGTVLRAPPPPHDYDLVVDGLFGIGLTRPLRAPYADWIAAVNESVTPVLALDVPSGLDADTGRVMGAAIHATRTLSFIADKPGLHTLSGPDHAGMIEIAPLQMRFAAPGLGESGSLLSPADFRACLRPRTLNSHKGSFGSLGVIGGSAGMTGAAFLAARAALYLGTGKVFIGFVDSGAPQFDPLHPELMLRSEEAVLEMALTAAVIGPGLGQGEAAKQALTRAIALPCPILLDADALNLVAADPALRGAIAKRGGATLMTPHPLEAARLLGSNTPQVQEDRIASAARLADLYKAIVVLKGAGSVIASPRGRWWINGTGNPGMASGGMGDVLSGIAGALLAQGFAAEAALQCAVHLHGAAADELVAEGNGPAGLTASETIGAARRLYNQWTAGKAPPR